jgi:hypothetical protein
MITFTKLGSYGRLGNQLFQYAILLAVGLEKKYEVKLPNFNGRVWHGQKCLLGNFNIEANYLSSNDIIKHRYVEKQGHNFKYDPKVFDVPDGTDFFGFFQNYQYYHKHKNEIIKQLTPKDNVLKINMELFDRLKYENKGYEIVSLHLRRGDSDLTMYGDAKLNENSEWYKYFQKAKEEFEGKKTKFLLFTGGNRQIDNSLTDYQWCRKNFIGDEYLFIDGERTTINDFCLMLHCDHHILSPVSSFSWWVGFLNSKKNKITITPKKYHFLKKEMDDNFYPSNFILK